MIMDRHVAPLLLRSLTWTVYSLLFCFASLTKYLNESCKKHTMLLSLAKTAIYERIAVFVSRNEIINVFMNRPALIVLTKTFLTM